MKRRFAVLAALMVISLPTWADITAKPDGTVTCTGTAKEPCTGSIGPQGETVICQGKICMEIKRPPKDDK